LIQVFGNVKLPSSRHPLLSNSFGLPFFLVV
jgi:hypothetical protein